MNAETAPLTVTTLAIKPLAVTPSPTAPANITPKPRAFHMKRLTDQDGTSDILPWDFQPSVPIPDEVRKDKEARNAWIANPKTIHHVYSFYQGLNENLRVTKPRGEGEGNPPYKQYALVADYDHPAELEFVLKNAKGLSHIPNRMERTLSGNWRYIWLLEAPLLLPSYEFAVHLQQKFAEFAFDPALGMIGFDRGAWEAPERLYTNSCAWTKLHDRLIPANVAQG